MTREDVVVKNTKTRVFKIERNCRSIHGNSRSNPLLNMRSRIIFKAKSKLEGIYYFTICVIKLQDLSNTHQEFGLICGEIINL